MCGPLQRSAFTSFPEGAEQQVQGQKEGETVQKRSNGQKGSQYPIQALMKSSGGPMQMRGGPTVGRLCVKTSVVSQGLTAGHAWLSYTPTGGSGTTYGTWGNVDPIGLHRDLEVGRPADATRCSDLDATDKTALDNFVSSNTSWGMINNCSSFAARGWLAVTGEHLNYTSFGIPNPGKLGKSIVAAGGTLNADATGGSSASSGSSYGSSSVDSSATSSYKSSSL